MSQLFASGGQSIGVSASASVLPMNPQDWSPLEWTGWISFNPKDCQESSPTPQFKGINYSVLNFLHSPTLTSIHNWMWYGKIVASTIWTFVSKIMSLLFNMLSRFVKAFLPRSQRLNFMAAVTICSDFGAQENKVCHCFNCFPIYLPWSDGTRCHDL